MTHPLSVEPGFDRDDVPVLIRKDGAYVLLDTLVYKGSQGDSITVYEEFVTDLATVPRFLTALVPIAGVHNRAAILHDALCVRLAAAHRGRYNADVDSVDTDGLFRQCLRLLGVPWLRRWTYWTGVRWGALANGARRGGWFRRDQLVRLIPLSLLLLVLIGVPAIVSAVWVYGGLLLGKLVNAVRRVIPGGGPPPTPPAVETRRRLAARRKP